MQQDTFRLIFEAKMLTNIMETFHSSSSLYLKFEFAKLETHRNLANILEGKLIALIIGKGREFTQLWTWNEKKKTK